MVSTLGMIPGILLIPHGILHGVLVLDSEVITIPGCLEVITHLGDIVDGIHLSTVAGTTHGDMAVITVVEITEEDMDITMVIIMDIIMDIIQESVTIDLEEALGHTEHQTAADQVSLVWVVVQVEQIEAV